MSKTISAKDREDAEVLCLLRADARRFGGDVDAANGAMEASRAARNLSHVAWSECAAVKRATAHLEAAALIRDGWCPGDPVVRLGR